MSGSDIESNDPVSKKPRLEDQDKDQDSSDTSDDEYVNSCSLSDYCKEFDFSTNIPPALQWRERSCISDTPPDSELGQIMSKITRLKATGFKGISFTARSVSDAFKRLIIFSDPGGVKVSYEDRLVCVDPYGCLYYITLLKKLVDSRIVSAEKIFFDSARLRRELVNYPHLSDEEKHDCFKLLDDYSEIYQSDEFVEISNRLRQFLLEPESKSKEKYRENPKSFEEMLRKDYRFIGDGGLTPIFEAFVKWWTSDSEKYDEESARKLIDNLCERALKERINRLKLGLWTGLDYIKLKLDVANVVGIYEIPDEIVDFVLPEHHRWSSLKWAFEPVPYEFERMAKLR